jgi:REP element-mobilizing transposase RayT
MPATRRAVGTRGRKHLRRLDVIHDSSRAPLFYLTCCVGGRRKILAQEGLERILVTAWETSPAVYGWQIGRYVGMPDHVHFFAAPCRDDARRLSGFVGSWKRWTAREIRQTALSEFDWQREFFDHFMRSGESYDAKWTYVRDNLVRAGLVSDAGEWPFQGELSILEW